MNENIILDEASKEKHLNLKPLNVNNFIKVNDLQEIDDPMFFSRNNIPTVKGLLSNEIFGITKEDRTSIFAYIPLAGEVFMHPLAYKVWCRLDSNVSLCAHEISTFKYDINTGKLKEDPTGETGMKYLQKIIKTVNFKKSASLKRNVKIDFLEKYRDKLFIENFVVIPAGYRDVDTESDGRVGVGEINKLYNAIIRDCKALAESEDFGLSLNGSLRGRIQESIVAVYDWLVFGRDKYGNESQASGLSRKLGLIRRAGMKKSFDWGSRLVICGQDLRKESLNDLTIDTDTVGLPLAAICANFFPYIIFWIRQHFENNFNNLEYLVVFNPKTKQQMKTKITDWREQYNDERIKKELDRFMHGMSNRFIPIEAPIPSELYDKKNTPYLIFKGFHADSEEHAKSIMNGTVSPEQLQFSIHERPLTWCDLIYQAAIEMTRDKTTLITRFPVDSYWNQFPAKIKVISTIKTEPMIVDNEYYKEYPVIKMEDIGKNTTNFFTDVALINNVRLDSMKGDYDGDTISSKGVYSIEANDELFSIINSKKHYIGLNGICSMVTHNEGIQSLYDLTFVLKGDKDKLTKDIEF